jgi:hypothetical protein
LARLPLARLMLERSLYAWQVRGLLDELGDDTSGTKDEIVNRVLDNPHFERQQILRYLSVRELRLYCRQRGFESEGGREDLIRHLEDALFAENVQDIIDQKRLQTSRHKSGTRTVLGMPITPVPRTNQVFVAYPYRMEGASEYRLVFGRVEQSTVAKFAFADERITDKHILQKICQMILESRVSLFEITDWNANVALELGLAYGFGSSAYISLNSSKSSVDVPADIKGLVARPVKLAEFWTGSTIPGSAMPTSWSCGSAS